MAKFTTTGTIDFLNFDLADLGDGTIANQTTTFFERQDSGDTDKEEFFGTGFKYAINDVTAGTINHITSTEGGNSWDLSSFSMSVASLKAFITAGDAQNFLGAVFVGNDSITGSSGADHLLGYKGNDTIDGNGGLDTLEGGLGNDTYILNNAGVLITEKLGEGTDTVISSVTATLDANVENLTLTGVANINATGNGGANVLTGNDGDNVLSGLDGADKMIGGKGNDTYVVDNAKDTVTESLTFDKGGGIDLVQSSITYTLGANVENLTLAPGFTIDGTGNTLDNQITGNDEANKLLGMAGADSLLGGGGNDTLDGGTNTALAGDTLEGGLGNDLYIVDSALDIVNPDSGGLDTLQTNQLVPDGGIAGIENYIFTGTKAVNFTASDDNTDNKITGTSAGDTFDAKGGDDSVAGLAGNDTLTGGAGDDTLDGGAGTDRMDGGDGDDLYIVDNAKDIVNDSGAGGDTDTVRASVTVTLAAFVGIENIELTGTGAINATGNDEDNVLKGNSGANKLDGVVGDDTMDGGKGNDTYVVDSEDDQVSEDSVLGGGVDTVLSSKNFTLSANIENLTLTGTDPISGTGNALANIITGNDGANILEGGTNTGAAGDTLLGGKGDDTYIVDNLKDTVTESLANDKGGGIDLVQSKVTFTLGNNLDDLELIGTTKADGTGNALANHITGNDWDNKLQGLAGNDTLVANDGNDTLDGGVGDDSMAGGDGNDFYIQDSAGDKISDSGGAGDTLQTNQQLIQAIAGIENYIFTGKGPLDFDTGAGDTNTDNRITATAAADLVRARGGDDSLAGLAGNDTLIGDDGNDTIDGGVGADSMDGGAGNDTYVIDNVKDVIADSGGIDTLTASVSVDLSTFGGGTVQIENATLIGTAALNLTGDKGDNLLTGNTGANKIDGGLGDDSMVGGAGNDTYTVDSAGDTITEKAGEGTDLVQSSISFDLGSSSNLENLTLTGTDNIDGTGNELKNLITGNSGKNILLGNDDADTLIGNGGDDSLSGGKGADSLSGGDGNDTLDGGADADKQDKVVDKMAGGAGDDTYIVNTGLDVVTEAANAGRDTVIANGIGWILGANFEDLVLVNGTNAKGIGNAANNSITGSDVTDTSITTSGDDTINGMAGNDTIDGKSGDDTLAGAAGNDSIDGGDGLDTVQFGGKSTDYTISAPDADGRITISTKGTDGTDVVVNVEFLQFLGDKVTVELHAKGTDNDDKVFLTSAPEGFDGLLGNDLINGDGGNDTLEGDGGNDTLIGSTGNDSLSGGIGVDEYDHAGTAADGNDTVAAGDNGLDTLLFTGTNLYDLGFSRSDTSLVVGAVKSGQTAFDGSVIVVDHYAGGAIGQVLIDTQFNTLYGTNADQAKFVFTPDIANGIDNVGFTEVLLGTTKSDTINGNDGFLDILVGNGGDDTLNGGAGDDWLRGGAGNDKLDGGAGVNTADYSTATGGTGIVVDLSTGKATSDGDGGQDTLANIQNVRGSAGADSITGSTGDNVFEGGVGNDTFDGNGGNDQVDYSKATSKVTIDLTDGTATGDLSVGTDNLLNIERVLGSQFSDNILGKAGLFAELDGGKGNDTLDGAGSGYASYYDSPGAVTANLGTGTASDGWGTTDTLKNLVGLTGSAFNDSLTGNGGVNTLDGGAGNDTLTGGSGNDSIVGGLGTDTAAFSGKSGDYSVVDNGDGTITVTDQNTSDGNDGADTLSGIENLKFSDTTIDDANDPPVNSVPAAQSTNEDTALVFNSTNKNLITVSDPDADGADIQVTLHVDHGTLDVTNASGLVITGDKSGDVTLTGTITEINAALNGMSYTPASNYNGSDTLKITTDDQGHTGTGGALTDTDNVAITINSVNDAPVASTASASGDEDTTIPIILTGTDVDGTIASITLTSLPANGTLYTDIGLSTPAATSTAYPGSSVTFYFVPNANFNGAPTFQFTVTDNQGGSDASPATATITVNAVNDAPVNSVPAAQTTAEDTALTFSGAGKTITVSDVDAGGSDLKVTLHVDHGTLDAVDNGGLVIGGDKSGTVTLTGTLSEINAGLNGLVYTPTAGYNGSDTLAITTDDQGATGSGGNKTDSDSIGITVSAVNDPPVNTVPAAQTTAEDTALTFSGAGKTITVSDVDAGGSDLKVTLHVDHGTLDAVDNGTLVITGDKSGDVTLTGTLTEINTGLNGLVYTPAADYNGSDTLAITTDDQGATGSGGNKTDSDSVGITVTAVNDAPVNSVPAAQTTNEDTPLTFSGAGKTITISDVDAGTSDLKVTLHVDHGTLNAVDNGTLVIGGDKSGTVTLTGTLTEINTGLNGLVYTPTADYNGADTLTITTDDQGATGGGSKTDSDPIGITVTAVNDAPVNSVPAAQTTAEDTALTFSGAGKTITISDVDAGGSDLKVTLHVDHGTLDAVDNGTLVISGDKSGDVTLTGTLTEINTGLNGLVYTPAANYNGSDTLTITTDDEGATGTGGNKTDSDPIGITVTAVNDAPVNSFPGAQTTNEDTAITFSGAKLISISDVDAGSSDVQVVVSVSHGKLDVSDSPGLTSNVGDGTATVTLVGSVSEINTALNGMIYTPTADYNGSDTLSIATSDKGNTGTGGTLTDNDSVGITITAVNDAPVNSVPAAQSTAEDTSLTFSSGKGNAITVSDVDAGGSDLKVTLHVDHGTLDAVANGGLVIGGDKSGDVTLTGTLTEINTGLNGLVYTPAADYNGSDTLAITTDDQGATGSGGSESDSDSIGITITAVNDAPVNTVPTTQTVDDDVTLTFTTGNLISVKDVDAGTDDIQVTLSVTDGTLHATGISGVVVGTNDTDNVTLTGDQAKINSVLDGLEFHPTAGLTGATLTIVTNDQTHTGSGGAKSDTDNVDIIVNAHLTGDDDANTLAGGSGNDTITGNGGDDSLSGGGGSDHFVYGNPPNGADTIGDFQAGKGGDVINIADLLVGFDDTKDLVTDGFVQIVNDGGKTAVQVDADGNVGGADFTTLATLSNINFGDVDAATLVANGNIVGTNAEP